AGRDLVVGVDDVVTGLPVLLGLPIRKRPGSHAAQMATRKPPRRGDNLARSRESQIQRRRTFFGPPWEGGRGKGFFEVHHARGEAAVIDPGNTTKSSPEVADRKTMDFLPFRHREDAKGRRGNHAEG